MNKSMRGLTVFISDLKNSKTCQHEEERINQELANIRNKFKVGHLNSYQKKKYICKLLYIYILGWEIDFGHMEAVHLISSQKYSEKQIGYLAITLLLHEKHDLTCLVINSIKQDLLDPNEYYNCLALHAIANIGGKEMGDILASDVNRLLVSPVSKNFVKKKASLTLLCLHRKNPDVIRQEWAESIISTLDDPDLGVSLSITSLLISLAQENSKLYERCYLKAINKLKRIVIDREYSYDYVYYKVPAPWLQIKLLRLLQYYSPPDDKDTQELICKVLQFIISSILHELPKNVQQNNIQNAILFEAINVTIHIDIDETLTNQTIHLLSKFISYKEINSRYLGLKALIYLAEHVNTFEPFRKYQDIIIQSLKDKDISIQRKALELLYYTCDSNNTKTIVNELIHYLENANRGIKEDIAIRIAILAEKHVTERQWYVDIMLQLINISKEHIGDDILHRFIQVIENNKELQKYSAKTILKYLKNNPHENMIKLGGYILGEFGHLISDSPESSPIEQFISLHIKFNTYSPKTQALLMSTYIKFVNLFPEIKLDIQVVFEEYANSIDSELQQRACEYLALCHMPNNNLLQELCGKTYPFLKNQSFLVSKLLKQKNEDKRLENIKEKKSSREKNIISTKDLSNYKTIDFGELEIPKNNLIELDTSNTNSLSSSISSSRESDQSISLSNLISDINYVSLSDNSDLSKKYEANFNELLCTNEGILYEDEEIEIYIHSKYRNHLGKMELLYKNKSQLTYTSFTSSIQNLCESNLSIVSTIDVPCTLEALKQVQQTLNIENRDIFLEPPSISISYMSTSMKSLTLKLPIVLSKFSDGVELDSGDFFHRWRQIGKSRECQKIFAIKDKEKNINFYDNVKILQGFGWEILKEIDTNNQNIVGASVLYTSQGGKYGSLLRLEPNYEAKMYRITIRSTKEEIANHLESLIEKKLSENI
ncbi:hypothetical protein T552_01888 [Pneumocystis carinii B80]|uniref:AP-2 complex subunit alpha n=1 Tax=Pneumocystis carinii (strain B80) TaxID=1408658 RepID=A0A0W4ZI34_PNEC8|nr:hypothetical protein T552_01888 [Pneumocystis carinii B80]KTW28026.1 hypothetical protein T552_01888 [Pneumocystis carinii B80]